MIKDVPVLISNIRSHFDVSLDRFKSFYDHGIMVEGWFKGELITVLDSLRRNGEIEEFDREVRVERRRVDLTVELDGCKHWIELKHWLNGYQAGTFYGTSFYFGDPTSVGITNDVNKLVQIASVGFRWILILAVSNPGEEEWRKGIEKYNAKFAPSFLISRTRPSAYPDEFFLGLLEVS